MNFTTGAFEFWFLEAVEIFLAFSFTTCSILWMAYGHRKNVSFLMHQIYMYTHSLHTNTNTINLLHFPNPQQSSLFLCVISVWNILSCIIIMDLWFVFLFLLCVEAMLIIYKLLTLISSCRTVIFTLKWPRASLLVACKSAVC